MGLSSSGCWLSLGGSLKGVYLCCLSIFLIVRPEIKHLKHSVLNNHYILSSPNKLIQNYYLNGKFPSSVTSKLIKKIKHNHTTEVSGSTPLLPKLYKQCYSTDFINKENNLINLQSYMLLGDKLVKKLA